MLQTVMRSSIDIAANTDPAYSTAWPTPPAAPIFAMIARITSLAATPKGRTPLTAIRIVRGFRCQRHWVASTCSTSDEPMPKARQPKAPWVEVWESPHTSRIPGWVTPCSGPITWTMPVRASPGPKKAMPLAAVLRVTASTFSRISGSINAMPPGAVGT